MEPFNTFGPGSAHSPFEPADLEAGSESHNFNSLKRKFEILNHDEFDNPHAKLPKQRSYHSSSSSSKATGAEPCYLVVHKVTCTRAGEHYNHIQSASYLDVPQLFAADSKASTLRGRKPLLSIDEYFDNHPGITILVFKHYNCQHYYRSVEEGFEGLPIPKLDSSILAQIRTNFFVLREDGNPAQAISEDMQILSRDLQSALAVSGLLNVREVSAPYLEIYRKIDLLKSPTTNLSDLEQTQIDLLLKYLQESWMDDFEDADYLFERGQISKRHLSKLFGPGDVLVTSDPNKPVAYLLEGFPSPEVGSDTLAVTLTCWSWKFDGLFQKVGHSIRIPWPSSRDVISITELSTYPLRYDKSGMEKKLRERGLCFWACRKRRFIGYNPPKSNFKLQTTNPRYMVDFATYWQMHSNETNSASQIDHLGTKAMEQDAPPEDPFLLLLPDNILGYGFHDKKWRTLSVDRIHEISWNKSAFDRLVLEAKKKELIKALVTAHVAANNTPDIIEGKGNGLIILLHGAPGTGKTLTAESVAELAGKPLYRVTCGDIGTDPEGVEKYLESVLYIGTIWGCVVLLDEADVFLEERTPTDLQRNAVVSVFLRVLEYYEGILILTSNRVGTFDEAFKSRVQLAMHYPSLDEKGRWEIWNNFIRTLKDLPDVKYDLLRDKIDVLARHKLNGRQIRNTVNTARQLASFRKEQLDYTHFEQAIDVTNEFEDFVAKAHGHSDEDWARAQGTR